MALSWGNGQVVTVANNSEVSFDSDNFVKIPGLYWQPTFDAFVYKVVTQERSCTKRHMLSDIARVFDPLGFLAPLTFVAKLLIQHLWTLGIGWDEKPSDEIQMRWQRYQRELSVLSSLQVDRCLLSSGGCMGLLMLQKLDMLV